MVKLKDFSRPLSVFQGKFCFQGLFKTVLYIQVLFKSVRTLRNLYVLVVKKVSRLSTLILPIFFVRMMIMLSAYYICYLHVYSNAHQRFLPGYQTIWTLIRLLLREWPDQGPYCFAGVLLQILNWGLRPMKLVKIPKLYLELDKGNCDTISRHINYFVIFIHKNLNSGVTLSILVLQTSLNLHFSVFMSWKCSIEVYKSVTGYHCK